MSTRRLLFPSLPESQDQVILHHLIPRSCSSETDTLAKATTPTSATAIATPTGAAAAGQTSFMRVNSAGSDGGGQAIIPGVNTSEEAVSCESSASGSRDIHVRLSCKPIYRVKQLPDSDTHSACYEKRFTDSTYQDYLFCKLFVH